MALPWPLIWMWASCRELSHDIKTASWRGGGGSSSGPQVTRSHWPFEIFICCAAIGALCQISLWIDGDHAELKEALRSSCHSTHSRWNDSFWRSSVWWDDMKAFFMDLTDFKSKRVLVKLISLHYDILYFILFRGVFILFRIFMILSICIFLDKCSSIFYIPSRIYIKFPYKFNTWPI